MDSNFQPLPNNRDAFDGNAIDGHPIDGEDFRRLGIHAEEWRPSVIRRAASRSARGLARRLLRHQSPKAVQQLTQVSLSTYRLLDPRRRDDASARAHIGRILPQTLSSAEGVLFQAAVLNHSAPPKNHRPATRPANVDDDAFGKRFRVEPERASTLVEAPPVVRRQTGAIAEPSPAAVEWQSSLQQDDILQAGLRWRRWNRVARRFGVAGILLASILVGVVLGLGAGDDAPPATTAKDVMPAHQDPSQATTSCAVDWVGPRTMPVPDPIQLAESERRFADCYVDPKGIRTIDQMEQAIAMAETAFEDPDPLTRYVASLHATHWSWAVEPLDATGDRLEQFAHSYDLDLAAVVTQSYVSAIRCARKPEVAELVLGALPSVIDFLERSGEHRDSLMVLDHASAAVRPAGDSLERLGGSSGHLDRSLGHSDRSLGHFDSSLQRLTRQAEQNRELADWIDQRFPVEGSFPEGTDPLMVDAVGQYLTGVIERWDEGLDWLAENSDPLIAQAAQSEIEWERTGAGSPAEVAERWEAVADRVGGRSHRLAVYRHIADLLENETEAVLLVETNRQRMRALVVPVIFRSR